MEEIHVYVNYALGDERLEEMYGLEEWGLKRMCDPEGNFGFYAPIH
jgi:hypothetical protein